MFSLQAHLLSVFDNIKTVTFHDKEYDRITHINSKEPETIEVIDHAQSLGTYGKFLPLPIQCNIYFYIFNILLVVGEASPCSGQC